MDCFEALGIFTFPSIHVYVSTFHIRKGVYKLLLRCIISFAIAKCIDLTWWSLSAMMSIYRAP